VLEAMARALYLEWFVCFRFPGHEDHPRVSTSLGEVPSGWDVVRLDDIAELTKGLSYKGSGLTDHGDPMVNLKCISAGGGFRRGGVKPYSGDYRDRHGIAPGDLVIANTDLTQAGNIIGSVARVPRRGFELGGLASHHLTIVRSKGADHSYWLLCALGDSRFRDFAKGRASGTTVLGFRNDDAASYPVVLPPLSVRKSFESVLAPVVELQEKLEDRMEVLRVTRDLLLPRLLSGQLELEADRP